MASRDSAEAAHAPLAVPPGSPCAGLSHSETSPAAPSAHPSPSQPPPHSPSAGPGSLPAPPGPTPEWAPVAPPPQGRGLRSRTADKDERVHVMGWEGTG